MPVENPDLRSRAMLAEVSVSVWPSRAFDKKVSKEVAENHDVGERMGRYNKNVVPVNKNGDYAVSYRKVRSAENVIRNTHKLYTSPWRDEGSRILSGANYFKWVEAINRAIAQFEDAVDVYVEEFPELKRKARRLLNAMYDADNYPEDIKAEFKASADVFPIPSGDDFRVTLTDDAVTAIRAQIEARVRSGYERTVMDGFIRLKEKLEPLIERLGDPEKVFRDSLIDNLGEVCDLIPALNITGNPDLERMVREVKEKLVVDPSSLRDDPSLRSHVVQEAEEIYAQMASFMEAERL